MKQIVDCLVELKHSKKTIYRMNSKTKFRSNDFLRYPFTRSDIHRLLLEGIIKPHENLAHKDIVQLILEGRLDFYKIAGIHYKEQFTKNELKKIIHSPHFYRMSKAGMQCEPVALLNARTMVIYQKNITPDIIMEILDKVDITKTLKSKKKKFIELARMEKNSAFELFLELMEGK